MKKQEKATMRKMECVGLAAANRKGIAGKSQGK
jgi:hypothetical protein